MFGRQRETSSLLNAESSLRLLDDEKDAFEPDVQACGSMWSYPKIRRAGLILAFTVWTIMVIPLLFWMSLPFFFIRSVLGPHSQPYRIQFAPVLTSTAIMTGNSSSFWSLLTLSLWLATAYR